MEVSGNIAELFVCGLVVDIEMNVYGFEVVQSLSSHLNNVSDSLRNRTHTKTQRVRLTGVHDELKSPLTNFIASLRLEGAFFVHEDLWLLL